MPFAHGMPGHGLGQAQIYGSLKPANEIPTAIDVDIAIKTENTHTPG